MYFFLASVFPGCPAGRPTNAHREHPRPRTWSPSTFSPKGRPTVLGTAIPGRAGGRGESDAPPAAAGGSQVTGTQRRRQVPAGAGSEPVPGDCHTWDDSSRTHGHSAAAEEHLILPRATRTKDQAIPAFPTGTVPQVANGGASLQEHLCQCQRAELVVASIASPPLKPDSPAPTPNLGAHLCRAGALGWPWGAPAQSRSPRVSLLPSHREPREPSAQQGRSGEEQGPG